MTKKMHISFILDETGSMVSVREATISGFNEYIQTLKADKKSSKALFTLTKFNSLDVNIVCSNVPVSGVDELNDATYRPAANTPLYDAIGRTVRTLEKEAKKSDSVLVVIQTDGQENSSKEFTRQGIFDLISEKKKDGWTFVFLGADQDAWLAGMTLGLDRGNVANYTAANTRGAFERAAIHTVSYGATGGVPTSDFFSGEDNLQ